MCGDWRGAVYGLEFHLDGASPAGRAELTRLGTRVHMYVAVYFP